VTTQEEIFKRVSDDVDAIVQLAKQLNQQVGDILDKTSLDGLCDSLKFDPELWDTEFLETIMIIREGLFSLREQLYARRDDDAAYSTERLLDLLSRLHTDLFGALRSLNPPSLNNAQEKLAALVKTPYIDVRLIQRSVTELKADVNELLTRTHVTFQHFEVHLMRVQEKEVMRTTRLVVQRMSATAFAIKVSLEQNIIYQGVFRFLAEGADKIVDELKTVTEHFKTAYKDKQEFSDDLSRLVEKGSKLTKDIAKLLHEVFSEGPIEAKQLKLKATNTLAGEPMVCAVRLEDGRVMLGGKDGSICVVDTFTGKITDRHQPFEATINSLSRTSDSAVVAGTQVGLETINPTTMVRREFNAIFEENISAVAVAPWGLVSGTRDGIARRWILDSEKIVRYGAENLKLGRSIQRMLVVGDNVAVAAGQELIFLDDSFKVDWQIPIDFPIRDMAPIDSKNILICGDGRIAHVKLTGGRYTKYLAASEQATYTCIAPIDANTFCVGNDDGLVTAIDLNSSSEIGVMNVQFPVRGMLKTNNKLLAYGGSWQGKGRSIALLDWEEVIHRSKETPNVSGP